MTTKSKKKAKSKLIVSFPWRSLPLCLDEIELQGDGRFCTVIHQCDLDKGHEGEHRCDCDAEWESGS